MIETVFALIGISMPFVILKIMDNVQTYKNKKNIWKGEEWI